jgi:hypothetical protein
LKNHLHQDAAPIEQEQGEVPVRFRHREPGDG